MNNRQFGADYYSIPATEIFPCIRVLDCDSNEVRTILDREGQKASIQIYSRLTRLFDGRLDEECALFGLALFGDYTLEERQNPGSHSNIRLLLDVVKHKKPFLLKADSNP